MESTQRLSTTPTHSQCEAALFDYKQRKTSEHGNLLVQRVCELVRGDSWSGSSWVLRVLQDREVSILTKVSLSTLCFLDRGVVVKQSVTDGIKSILAEPMNSSDMPDTLKLARVLLKYVPEASLDDAIMACMRWGYNNKVPSHLIPKELGKLLKDNNVDVVCRGLRFLQLVVANYNQGPSMVGAPQYYKAARLALGHQNPLFIDAALTACMIQIALRDKVLLLGFVDRFERDAVFRSHTFSQVEVFLQKTTDLVLLKALLGEEHIQKLRAGLVLCGTHETDIQALRLDSLLEDM